MKERLKEKLMNDEYYVYYKDFEITCESVIDILKNNTIEKSTGNMIMLYLLDEHEKRLRSLES